MLTSPTELIAPLDEGIQLLPALEDTLDSLMQHNLRLIQLLLDLQDTIGLLWILILLNIPPQLRHLDLPRSSSPLGAGVGSQELIDDLGEELVRHELRILVVGDADASKPLGSAVYVKRVALLFDVLTRAGSDPPRDRAGEHGEELANR